jgi:hypothetical protein
MNIGPGVVVEPGLAQKQAVVELVLGKKLRGRKGPKGGVPDGHLRDFSRFQDRDEREEEEGADRQ